MTENDKLKFRMYSDDIALVSPDSPFEQLYTFYEIHAYMKYYQDGGESSVTNPITYYELLDFQLRDYCLGAYWLEEDFFTIDIDGQIQQIDDPENNFISRAAMQNATTVLVNL